MPGKEERYRLVGKRVYSRGDEGIELLGEDNSCLLAGMVLGPDSIDGEWGWVEMS